MDMENMEFCLILECQDCLFIAVGDRSGYAVYRQDPGKKDTVFVSNSYFHFGFNNSIRSAEARIKQHAEIHNRNLLYDQLRAGKITVDDYNQCNEAYKAKLYPKQPANETL